MCMRERSEEHTSELQSLRHLVCRLLLENTIRSEEHTSELQSLRHLVCRLLLDKRCAGRTSSPRATQYVRDDRVQPGSGVNAGADTRKAIATNCLTLFFFFK